MSYWLNPGKGNLPMDYWSKTERSEFLIDFIKDLPKGEILEIGCNSGRNLKYLTENGFTAFGIDINPEAVEFAKAFGNDAFNFTIEEYFKSEGDDNIILSMAVLEHLPYSQNWVLAEMAKANYVICIEDEKTKDKEFYPRNYKNVFESLGMTEIKHETNVDLFVRPFECRIFQRL